METFFTILHLQLKLHRRLKLLGREFIYLLPDQAVSGGGGGVLSGLSPFNI
jgi:hypothetical protein